MDGIEQYAPYPLDFDPRVVKLEFARDGGRVYLLATVAFWNAGYQVQTTVIVSPSSDTYTAILAALRPIAEQVAQEITGKPK